VIVSGGGPTKLIATDSTIASRDRGAFEELTSLRGVVAPSLSPDARWVTYEKYGVGQGEIYIERFPLDGHPMRVPSDGGYEALFSAKGDKIFYRVGFGIVEVPLTVSGDTVSFGVPRPYVKFAFADFLGRGYKIGNDDRILVKLLPSTMPQSTIGVMTGVARPGHGLGARRRSRMLRMRCY
jgi:hypothetical protein